MDLVCDMIVVCFTFDTSVPAVLGWATFGLGHPSITHRFFRSLRGNLICLLFRYQVE